MAAKLAERGCASIIGSKSAIREIHARSENCVFLGRLDSNTGRTSYDREYVKEMEKKGTALFFMHDEGGLYFKGEYDDWVRKIYPEDYFGSSALKKVMFWGDSQRDVFRNSPFTSKFEVTGFPRFDLCKPEFGAIDDGSVADLKKKYGEFILVCGRFAAVNMVADDPSALGQRSYDIRVEGGSLKTKGKEQIIRSMFESWGKVSQEFSQFVPTIAKLALDFPEINFVLRPHPAEKESFYKDAFVHFDNVFIDKTGDVRPFIRACQALIHSECTTGLEAELCCKPNINYRPCADLPISGEYEVAGASDIGVIVKNYNELSEYLESIYAENFPFEHSPYNPERLIANTQEEFYSADRICDLIMDWSDQVSVSSSVKSKISSYDYILYYVKQITKKVVKKALGYLGVEKFKRLIVGGGDLKFYQYSDEEIERIWKAVGSEDTELATVGGVIYVRPIEMAP
ncbi:hypothetical protein GCM10009113_07910 [Marinobacter szutsaonensis]